jgi:hypothetical protein
MASDWQLDANAIGADYLRKCQPHCSTTNDNGRIERQRKFLSAFAQEGKLIAY